MLRYDNVSTESEAAKRKSPAKRLPIPEKPLKKRKVVHSSPISIEQTSEPIFDFEVNIDITTPHSPALTNISLASDSEAVVKTPLCREVSSKSKKHHRCIF